jgi:hypothetical protein
MNQWLEKDFLADGFTAWLSARPAELLSPAERQDGTLQDLELRGLLKHLHQVPPKVRPGPWVGFMGESLHSKPDVVVCGICQGKNALEKANWISFGPTIESVCGLDLSAQVATEYGAEHRIWIVDHEYAATAFNRGGDPELELEVGRRCAAFVRRRYPKAKAFATSDPAVRGDLYTTVSDLKVAKLYPNRVRKPYGIASPTLWDQFDYLACMASMAAPGLDGKRVWAVVDHDQLRPALAANIVTGGKVSALLFWPAPHLEWRHGAKRGDFVQMLQHIRIAPRRMHRSKNEFSKVHFDDSFDSLKDRLQGLAKTGALSDVAANEVLVYLDAQATTHATKDIDTFCHMLAIALSRFRQQKYG